PYLFLSVACGRYRGRFADPLTGTGEPFEAINGICLEFRIGNPVLDITDPSTWALLPSAGGPDVPYWFYTDADYVTGPLGQLWTPPGEGAGGSLIQKTFAPVCVQRLSGGRHLIANYAGVIENLRHANCPTATSFGTPPSLSSDVFEVETHYNPAAPNDPFTQTHVIDVHKCIPNPWLEDWADPINQPSYAQRCQESLASLRP
ncbi:MAG: hypothetical protein ACUVX8_13445, partial [Candidatus Zipacnadales bacterium]